MIVNTCHNNYARFPETRMLTNKDSTVLGRYINLADKYAHVVLCNAIEATSSGRLADRHG
ncbi:hypothetical protein CEQ90_19630 [Lewinellaceae bacterium SD302]|nr:hypothetical protein CEQ90_19630 [Lewinellaceae bacterium SD302]